MTFFCCNYLVERLSHKWCCLIWGTIFKKDSQLFSTHSSTNSTLGSLFNGKPVICGGSNPNGKVSSICSIFEDKSWRKFAQMSESRQYHTSIQIDENRLWVIGKNVSMTQLLTQILSSLPLGPKQATSPLKSF